MLTNELFKIYSKVCEEVSMSKTMNPGLGSRRFKTNRNNVCVMQMAALY